MAENPLREFGLQCARELAQAVKAESLETTQREFQREQPMAPGSRLVVIPARVVETLEGGRFVVLGARTKMGGRGDTLFHESHPEIRSLSLLVNKDFYVLAQDSPTLLRLRSVCGSDQELAMTVPQLRGGFQIIDPARMYTAVQILIPGVPDIDDQPPLFPRFTTTLADVRLRIPEPLADGPGRAGYWVYRNSPYLRENTGEQPEPLYDGYWQDKSCLQRVFGADTRIVVDLIHEDNETVCLRLPDPLPPRQIVAGPCVCVFVVGRYQLY